jgi:exodeoxyribonuclease VII small subunit
MSNAKKNSQEDGLTLESTMKSIEKLLETLENSETPLEQSLLAFEEGVQLIRKAQKTLAGAEQKVQLLLEKDAGPVMSDFNLDEDNR